MALKALMLRKKIDAVNKELERAKADLETLMTRETELAKAIEEASNIEDETADEVQKAVEEEVEKFEEEKSEAESKVNHLEEQVRTLEAELEEEETEDVADEDAPAIAEVKEERKAENKMETRTQFFGMTTRERDELFARDDVQKFIAETRTAIKEKRAITNVGLTIPEVFLGLLRENITDYSKLYRHVNVRSISGTARQLIMAGVGEGVWTECCANLNELSLGFYDLELDCYMVGGFYAVCNATIEDSDVALMTEILNALGQAIGYALDKAILYGKNTTANSKMPLGIVSRLAQTEAPSGYPATARPWVDLHKTNIKTIASGVAGAELISALAVDFGNAKGKYSRGEKVWVMNETTYTQLIASMVTVNSAGAIVTGINGNMPVIGGIIEVLDFVPDNVIIGGYFDLYTLAERAGREFATSEHVRFLASQTVMKGIARYDGTPAIAEAFVAIGINGVTPTAEMTFAQDTANEDVSA